MSTNTFSQWTQAGQNINGEAAGDFFGISVRMNDSGSIIAIGATLNDGNGADSGHVRVFENIGGTWTQIGDDINGPSAGDSSGRSFSLNDSGNIIAIGAHKNDTNGFDSGQVNIFENIGGVWTQIGASINGIGSTDWFGISVSLNKIGDIVAIAGYSNNDNGIDSGHVKIYKNIAGTWVQLGTDINGNVSENFGYDVSLNGSGTILSAGAPGNGNNGFVSGCTRVYEYITDDWVQIGADINGEAAGDHSGKSVDINDSGDVLAIGAFQNSANGSNSGHVRVFKNISNVWTQIGSSMNGEVAEDYFGLSLDLNNDGNILAVGALGNDNGGSNSGQTKIYENISGIWTLINSSISGEATGDGLGAVCLNGNGNKIVVGAYQNDNSANNAGNVKVLENTTLLSVVENNIGSHFKVYPNPASERVNIKLGRVYSEAEVLITSSNGKQIQLKKYCNQEHLIINISDYVTGVYFLKVKTKENIATIKLLVL